MELDWLCWRAKLFGKIGAASGLSTIGGEPALTCLSLQALWLPARVALVGCFRPDRRYSGFDHSKSREQASFKIIADTNTTLMKSSMPIWRSASGLVQSA